MAPKAGRLNSHKSLPGPKSGSLVFPEAGSNGVSGPPWHSPKIKTLKLLDFGVPLGSIWALILVPFGSIWATSGVILRILGVILDPHTRTRAMFGQYLAHAGPKSGPLEFPYEGPLDPKAGHLNSQER